MVVVDPEVDGQQEGLGPEVPFRLIAWADGRFTLEDPATSRVLDLSAFGPMNTAVFGRLLAAQASTTQASTTQASQGSQP